MKELSRSFLLGLTIMLPVILSVQIVLWFFDTAESWLKPVWVAVLSEQYYFPGLAIVTFLGLVTAVGFSSRLPAAKRLWDLPGLLLQKLPVIHHVYNMINDFIDLMAGRNFAEQSVVWVTMPGVNAKLIGIVTARSGDSGSRLSSLFEKDEIAVFLPLSYQAGGYLIVVPSSQVTEIDMSPGEALSLIMSAGLGPKQVIR